MKHAGPDALSKLAIILENLRERTTLQEKGVGVFYLKSKPFIHFHDDPSGVFADVKLGQQSFDRYRVTTKKEQLALLKQIDKHLSSLSE